MKILYDISGNKKYWYIASETVVNGAKIIKYESGYFPTEEEAKELLNKLESKTEEEK